MVSGADHPASSLRGRPVDEMHIAIAPVLLEFGERLFDGASICVPLGTPARGMWRRPLATRGPAGSEAGGRLAPAIPVASSPVPRQPAHSGSSTGVSRQPVAPLPARACPPARVLRASSARPMQSGLAQRLYVQQQPARLVGAGLKIEVGRCRV